MALYRKCTGVLTLKKLWQAVLQSLPDHRVNGTHPDLEEVLDSNLQNMCREILFDPSFSGQVLDFIEAQLQLHAVSPDDLLCMGTQVSASVYRLQRE